MTYSKEELKNLEWWRGFLAFIVFVAHIAQIVWFPAIGDKGIIPNILGCLANISVVFFFVLSGILISYSALNVCENDSFNWRKYLINRFSRIYPSLTIVLILCGILVMIFPLFNNQSINIIRLDSDHYLARDFFSADKLGFLKAFFMIQPGISQINGPLWSLFIEWWLYISALFVFLAIKAKGNGSKFLFSILSLLALLLSYYGYGIRVVFYIAIWYLGFMYTMYFRFNSKKYNILFISSLILFVILIMLKGISAININIANYKVYGLIQIIYSVLFIKVCFKYSGKFIFKDMSKYSYTLYILHFPIILFIFSMLHSYVLNDFLGLFFETIFLILIITIVSKFLARYTEDKYMFRVLIDKIITKNNNA